MRSIPFFLLPLFPARHLSSYPRRPDFTIGARCRPILHFIPRGWVASRGARTILLDVTSTLTLPTLRETLDPSSSPPSSFPSVRVERGFKWLQYPLVLTPGIGKTLYVRVVVSHLPFRLSSSFSSLVSKFARQLAGVLRS